MFMQQSLHNTVQRYEEFWNEERKTGFFHTEITEITEKGVTSLEITAITPGDGCIMDPKSHINLNINRIP